MVLSYKSADLATEGPIRCCPRGHPLTDENIWTSKVGRNYCRSCRSIRAKAYRSSHRSQTNEFGKQYHRDKIAKNLPVKLANLRVAIYDLRSAAFVTTAKKHGGDASRRWGKTHCIRGHPLYGPQSHVYRNNGKSDCQICASFLRRRAAAEQRPYESGKNGARLHAAFDRKQTISEWSTEFGLSYSCLHSRMRQRRFTLEAALLLPMKSRKTHCRRGHAYTTRTTIIRKDSVIQCRICKEAARHKRRAKNRLKTGKQGN